MSSSVRVPRGTDEEMRERSSQPGALASSCSTWNQRWDEAWRPDSPRHTSACISSSRSTWNPRRDAREHSMPSTQPGSARRFAFHVEPASSRTAPQHRPVNSGVHAASRSTWNPRRNERRPVMNSSTHLPSPVPTGRINTPRSSLRGDAGPLSVPTSDGPRSTGTDSALHREPRLLQGPRGTTR